MCQVWRWVLETVESAAGLDVAMVTGMGHGNRGDESEEGQEYGARYELALLAHREAAQHSTDWHHGPSPPPWASEEGTS